MLSAIIEEFTHGESGAAVRERARKKIDCGTVGTNSSRTRETIKQYVRQLVKRYPGDTKNELWIRIPEQDDADADVFRDHDNRLVDHTKEGGGKSISRSTFDRYVTEARADSK